MQDKDRQDFAEEAIRVIQKHFHETVPDDKIDSDIVYEAYGIAYKHIINLLNIHFSENKQEEK